MSLLLSDVTSVWSETKVDGVVDVVEEVEQTRLQSRHSLRFHVVVGDRGLQSERRSGRRH